MTILLITEQLQMIFEELKQPSKIKKASLLRKVPFEQDSEACRTDKSQMRKVASNKMVACRACEGSYETQRRQKKALRDGLQTACPKIVKQTLKNDSILKEVKQWIKEERSRSFIRKLVDKGTIFGQAILLWISLGSLGSIIFQPEKRKRE